MAQIKLNPAICFLAVFFGLAFGACTNDLKKIQEISAKQVNNPVDTTKQVDIIYSDSAKVKARVTSPLMLQIKTGMPDSYIVMPKKVRIVFYDNDTREAGNIIADTAYQYTGTKVIKLYKNVVVTNNKGDVFKSDELIWDMQNHKIFSNKPVDMFMANGNTGHGTAMETNEKFSPLTVQNQTGVIYVTQDMTQQ